MPIRVLDAATVGRIAAGEVVERPSSVVKELMENALDAGATSITVEIRGGGIDYLRVTDNGCGIEPEQVRLAFENHATSKLQSADQLDDIRTLGFRGEALPSIASVSHIEMRTRTKTRDSGTQLNIDGGQDLRVSEIGCPQGTTIVMRDLFYNIPVRRAFLKKPNYEGGLVSDVVSRMLVGNPGVSVRFINNGRTMFHSYGDGKLRNAIFAVYGKETAEKMIELDSAIGGTRIYGMLGIGDLAKQTRAHELFFINGRSVRCALLSKVLESVCRSRVTIGLYPMCALNLVLPPNAVDVNVHPNKLEVRFRDEEATMNTAEALLGSAFTGEHVLSFERDAAPQPVLSRESTVKEYAPIREAPPQPPRAPEPQGEQTNMFRRILEREQARLNAQTDEPKRLREDPEAEIPKMPELPPLPTAQEPEAPAPTAHTEDIPYRLVGVAFNTYIILEMEDSLLLIDQHAAHERLRFENYQKQLAEGHASQQLLSPMVIRLSAREMSLIRDNLTILEESGYSVEPFGENDIRVTAVPFVLGKAELRPIFLEMLSSLNRLRQATLDERRAEIAQMSCKGAVKGGDTLTDSEIRALISGMLDTEAPPTCPHGRPVVRRIPKTDLEKLFKRIQ